MRIFGKVCVWTVIDVTYLQEGFWLCMVTRVAIRKAQIKEKLSFNGFCDEQFSAEGFMSPLTLPHLTSVNVHME